MSTTSFFVLFESAAGYALFSVLESEDIALLLNEVQQGISDLNKFQRVIKLIAFHPFDSAENALENINAISEHEITSDLKTFLETNMSKSQKSSNKNSKQSLGVIEPLLATNIQENLHIPCRSDDIIRELVRGLRGHLSSLVKTLEASTLTQAQLGLAHAFSRAAVKFNPNRSDNMIIQAVALLDQLDKDLNSMAMRVKEWYSWHFPELKDIVKDNYLFARCAAFIKVFFYYFYFFIDFYIDFYILICIIYYYLL